MPKREEERTVLLIQSPEGIAVRKRPDKGLLAGLYEFPSLDGFAEETELHAIFPEAERLRRLSDAKHVFTHRIWRMRGWHIELRSAAPYENTFYADADAIRMRAFPSALRVYREIALDLLETKN